MAIEPARVACLVLAAGRGVRFGKDDKLAALLEGRPVLHHVLATLGRFPFAARIVVCRPDGPGPGETGFASVMVGTPDAPQSLSLRAGLAAMPSEGFDAVLIALGDMPLVSPAHIAALLARFDTADPRCVIASTDGLRRSPPALFAAGLRAELMTLEGDQGARDFLKRAQTVTAGTDELADVDTLADLDRIEAGLKRS